MLTVISPIGRLEIPEWEEKKLLPLSNDQLLEKAIAENKAFVISPAVFAMIEKRQLTRVLQKMICPSVGLRHDINHTIVLI